jgi:ABC-type multidrug transport system fused ATPase/permease subunit
MLAATWGDGQVAYSILWFFLFFIEVWLAISIFIDIFRSHDLKGWAKALWILFVFVLPLIGILAYFIFRGDKMRAHQVEARESHEEYARHYIQQVAGTPSVADEIAKLVELKNNGAITEDEFQRMKEHVINSHMADSSSSSSAPGD